MFLSKSKWIKFLLAPVITLPNDFVDLVVAILPHHKGVYAGIKRFFLCVAGAKVGNNVYIYPGVHIYSPKGFTIGNNVTISSNVIITAAGTVNIGNNVLIGYGSKILSANHRIPDEHGMIFGAGHDFKPVVICDGAWIGANVVVLPGIRIGEGAVVAAGAVVTKNVDAYTIVGGVPIKVIRRRN